MIFEHNATETVRGQPLFSNAISLLKVLSKAKKGLIISRLSPSFGTLEFSSSLTLTLSLLHRLRNGNHLLLFTLGEEKAGRGRVHLPALFLIMTYSLMVAPVGRLLSRWNRVHHTKPPEKTQPSAVPPTHSTISRTNSAGPLYPRRQVLHQDLRKSLA